MSTPVVPEPLTSNAVYHEYMSAAKPKLPAIPVIGYPSELHRTGPTRIVPFDLSKAIGAQRDATGPTVSASYLRLREGERLTTTSNASAQLYYVIRGAGQSTSELGTIAWRQGDVFVLPMTGPVEHEARVDSALYHVNDDPLVSYLGAKPVVRKFDPMLFPAERIASELARVGEHPKAAIRNRDAIILGNKTLPLIKSATHTLWSAVVQMNPGQTQRPHRHNSIAVDIVIAAEPGAYTLLGHAIDGQGNILNPQRVDWEPGAAFVTPPGMWHGHWNESGSRAVVMAVQEAAFYEYLRTLDIVFTGVKPEEVK
jgi:gentisate 1,2-dioxygenase